MADPLDFADPFWDDSSVETIASNGPKKLSYTPQMAASTLSWEGISTKSSKSTAFQSIPYLSKPVDSLPGNFTEYIFPFPCLPECPVSESKPVSVSELKVVGQGTIAVKSTATQSIEFLVSKKSDKGDDGFPKLSLKLTQTQAVFSKKTQTGETPLTGEISIKRPEASQFIPQTSPLGGTVYWLSIDRSNWLLRYGKYYTSNALTLVEMKLDADSGKWFEGFNIVEVKTDNNVGISIQTLHYVMRLTSRKNKKVTTSRLPVTMDLPPLVVTNEAVSLRDLDLARMTTWANLPDACQSLYHNIAGKNIGLDAEIGFKNLADAIHNSVTEKGHWAYNKLREKCKPDPQHPTPKKFENQYLRITIGSNKVFHSTLGFSFI